ncbi:MULTISPECIES: polysaccharide deacetylase family protein [Sporosarcina]|uniref:polysaccharide deacetylase family protein n=1 Tax=Sporosarcina TaxID=1569 RepID=UPI0015CF56E4|nr:MULTISPECIES: polysaccharide deacetylase family protein [Sporosarcina]WJY26224.1 polysaccharide deacetylase family protein [Sporosarcina sp. 0.2-SM1T-5]
MSKKKYRTLLAAGLFTALCSLAASPGAAAASSEVTLSKASGAYTIEGEALTGTATFMAGVPYELAGQDDRYTYLVFGNDKLAVPSSVIASTAVKKGASLPKGRKTMITQKRVSVASALKGGFRLGYVNPGQRLPVIGETKTHIAVNFGGSKGFIPKSTVKADPGIPVLMYHHIVEKRAATPFAHNNMVIDYAPFLQQMNYLKQNGWKTIAPEDLDNWLMLRKNLTDKTVLLTFDDGLLSLQKYAYPVLSENGFQATSFLITSRIKQQAQPWDDQAFQYFGLKEIRETADVFSFQHHTHGMHLRRPGTREPYLTSSSAADIKADIELGRFQVSKAWNMQDPNIRYLAYPFGQFNTESKQAIAASGIRMAFTTNPGNVKLGDNRYELKRQGISPVHSLKDFEKKLYGAY